jgi:hypothetical protein
MPGISALYFRGGIAAGNVGALEDTKNDMNHSNIYTKKQSRIIAWLLFLRAYSLFEAS